MKQNSFSPLLLMLSLLAVSCNKDNPASVQEEVYIPLISNSWTDVARADHRFNLTAPQSGVSQGTFTGEEVYQDSVDTFPLQGTFSNRNISFTVTKRGRDTTYAGRFTADTLIDLGKLKIFRFSQ